MSILVSIALILSSEQSAIENNLRGSGSSELENDGWGMTEGRVDYFEAGDRNPDENLDGWSTAETFASLEAGTERKLESKDTTVVDALEGGSEQWAYAEDSVDSNARRLDGSYGTSYSYGSYDAVPAAVPLHEANVSRIRRKASSVAYYRFLRIQCRQPIIGLRASSTTTLVKDTILICRSFQAIC
jgi:hypothetical protein